MPTLDTAATLGSLVVEHPAFARPLERFGLDYCCGGERTLAEACGDAGLAVDDVAAVLGAVEDGPREPWASMDPAELVDHLEQTHHRYLWDELPRLSTLVGKVVTVHRERHPELAEVQRCFAEIRADLEPHLLREERVLFPMIRELAGATTAPSFHCGTLANPISVMLREHDIVGDLLARLNRLTARYTPPADGCRSYEACYRGLAELEADTHLHIHKENNVLFPAVLCLEAAVAQATG